MSPVIIAAVGLVLMLDVITSLLVLFSKSYAQSQKLLQLLLIWVIPLLGAMAALVVILEDWRVSKPFRGILLIRPRIPQGFGIAASRDSPKGLCANGSFGAGSSYNLCGG
jgi:hypothetical protein